MMADLTELTVAELREGVAGGAFSAVEVAEAFNANVAAAQASLNASASTSRPSASVLLTSTVRPRRERNTSPGR